MRTAAEAAFWASAAGAAWVLVGYAAVLSVLPRRPWRRRDWTPRVSILVPTYRERDELPVKLRSLRELDYPAEALEVIVISDGEPELAPIASAAYPGAVVLVQPERRGKTAALNRGLEAATGEIVVLTDADNPLAPVSVRAAVGHLGAPEVWAAVGRLPGNGSAYDDYEHLLRRLESRSGSVVSASGGFIAVRRDRLPRFPEGVVNEDTWLLCQLARGGGRVVYEPQASSSEPPVSVAGEVERRARMGAGRTMLAAELRGLPARFAWRLASHKIGRLALPFLLVTALATSLALAPAAAGWRIVAALQVAAYGIGLLAAAGVVLPGRAGRLAGAARQFVVGNWAIAVGVVRAVRGRQQATWRHV